MADTKIHDFEIDSFSEAINDNDKLVIVYFSAPWCQPCKNMRPVFEKTAETLGVDNFIFGEVNIAASPTIAPTYGIKSVPSVAVYKQRNVIKIIPGEVNKTELTRQLTSLVH